MKFLRNFSSRNVFQVSIARSKNGQNVKIKNLRIDKEFNQYFFSDSEILTIKLDLSKVLNTAACLLYFVLPFTLTSGFKFEILIVLLIKLSSFDSVVLLRF